MSQLPHSESEEGSPTPVPPTARDHAKEAERLQALRDRLYARGDESNTGFVRHDLQTSHTTPAHTLAPLPKKIQTQPTEPLVEDSNTPDMSNTSRRTSFRLKLFIVGIVFLIGALLVSSAFLFLGTNNISGDNIRIDVAGPVVVGGGDVVNMQIAIANQNSLPIESATLIIAYPRGTQSVTEPGKELFSDRQQLNNIEPNEVVNVPLRFFVFGEENDEKEVLVSVEYRIRGSNATFYKEALPYTFKITSSPIIVNVSAVENIASGQEATIDIVVQSNSKEPLSNLILKASYPAGFDFIESDPETASGQDTWKLKSLKPGEEQKISLRGLVVGKEEEENLFNFTVGVANERDSFNIVSPLAVSTHRIEIERPFINVDVLVNGESDEVVIIDSEDTARVQIDFRNTLESTIYDGVILVELAGNALNDLNIKTQDGHYDSQNNTITWDSVSLDTFKELTPGENLTVTFTIDPRADIDTTPEIKFTVTTQANRIGEDNVSEEVVGTVVRTVKIGGVTNLTSVALHSEGPFSNSGPVPPVAEKTTEYSFNFQVKNGTNPVTDAEMTAILPSYVTWLDRTSDDDNVSYSATTRTVKWNIDELEANESKEVWVQVALTPSLSQVDRTPTLLESQRYKATDRFTGTIIRTEASALTTELLSDPDEDAHDGNVREED